MNKCNLIRKALLTYPIWVLVTSQSISLRLPSWSSPILMKQRPYQKRPRGPSPLPPTPFFAIFFQIRGFTPFTYGIVSSDVSEGQKSHTTLMLKCHPLFSVMTFSWNISSFNLWSQSGGGGLPTPKSPAGHLFRETAPQSVGREEGGKDGKTQMEEELCDINSQLNTLGLESTPCTSWTRPMLIAQLYPKEDICTIFDMRSRKRIRTLKGRSFWSVDSSSWIEFRFKRFI